MNSEPGIGGTSAHIGGPLTVGGAPAVCHACRGTLALSSTWNIARVYLYIFRSRQLKTWVFNCNKYWSLNRPGKIQPNVVNVHYTRTARLRIVPVAKTNTNRLDIGKIHALVCKLLQVDIPFRPLSY